jgi:hypothetical protein
MRRSRIARRTGARCAESDAICCRGTADRDRGQLCLDDLGFEILVELSGKLKEIPLPGDRVKVLFPA